jgi:hypothetical protein
MKKLIDFETLCKNCDSHYWYDNVCQAEKDTCPIWNSLPDAQEYKDGNYVLYEDHLKAIAEAESAAVKKFLNKTLSFECKEVDCGDCPNDALLCGLNIVLRAYGVDEVIKKVEAERG